MSGLTKKVGNKVYAVEECKFMPFGNAEKVIRKILNKLNKYEKIGSPSDLIRPVRCGECEYQQSCFMAGSGVYGDDDFCSKGERMCGDE